MTGIISQNKIGRSVNREGGTDRRQGRIRINKLISGITRDRRLVGSKITLKKIGKRRRRRKKSIINSESIRREITNRIESG